MDNVRTLDLDRINTDDFSKECINNLLGLWSKIKHHTWSVETVSYTEDLQRAGPSVKRAVPGHPTLFDYIYETELLSRVSMRPIHQICLDMEHVYLAKAYKLARKYCEPRDISAFVVDCVVCHPSVAQRKKLQTAAEAITHDDDGATPMFRLSQGAAKLVCTTEPPITPKFEVLVEPVQWRDFGTEEVQRLVFSGKSVFLNGFGGTGKTFAAKEVVKMLLEQGKQVCCTSYTHMASQNIAMPGAINGTLHHCLHKMPGFNGHAIIDEVSQIPLVLWAAILKWQLSGAKFIMLGDFNQFGPAFNRWRKNPISGTVQDTPFFMQLCGCNRVNFTQYKRGGDLDFFKLYTGMVGKCPVQCQRSVLKEFPIQPGLPDWSLTVSNKQRRQLNKQINEELHTTRGGVWINAGCQLDNQGFWLFEGLKLVGVATDHGIFNGQLYTVMEASAKTIRLRVYSADEELELSPCNIRTVRPAHAITFYSCQGRTLVGRVRLYVQHRHITTTHIVIGLSRATSPKLIECV